MDLRIGLFLSDIYNRAYLAVNKRSLPADILQNIDTIARDYFPLDHPTPQMIRAAKVSIIKNYHKVPNLARAIRVAQATFVIQWLPNKKLDVFSGQPLDSLYDRSMIEKELELQPYLQNTALIRLAHEIDKDMKRPLSLSQFAELIAVSYRDTIVSALRDNQGIQEIGINELKCATCVLIALQKNNRFHRAIEEFIGTIKKLKQVSPCIEYDHLMSAATLYQPPALSTSDQQKKSKQLRAASNSIYKGWVVLSVKS